MLDIKYIRDHVAEIEKNCANRGVTISLTELLALDEQRRELHQAIDSLRATRNKTSKGKPTADEIAAMRRVGEEIEEKEKVLAIIEEKYSELLLRVPNLTHPDVPIGGEDDFVLIETKGKVPTFAFLALDHEKLLTQKGWLDFERGAKVAGAKFYFAKDGLVRLNQAIITYGIEVATAYGYELIETPDLAKNDILRGIGFSPRGPESQVYSIEQTDLSLIGTAEITMGGYHAGEILDLSAGPKKYAALSHCFRTEAGTYGRESRGLYRVHQFTKLELFVYCIPEESDALHLELLSIEKEIAEGLGLSYRVIDVASGDLGAPAYRKFDIEAWMVMKDGYGEITSTSNCTDYQARRLNIKYKTDAGDTAFVHTLNGTAIVTSRFPIAIVEQHQQADGSIAVPESLQQYLGEKVL